MYRLSYSQKLPIDLPQAWDFFSSPANLDKITPPSLGLEIKQPFAEKIYPGQIIAYTVKPLWNISLEWVTEIVAVDQPHYFIDEQRFGPYTFWHHEHRFSSISNGVLIEDIIHYKVPYGILGRALHHLKIKGDLEHIFLHRKQVLDNLFGSYSSHPV